jgi:hypothetical protein
METKNFEEQSSTIRSISFVKGDSKLLVEFKSGGTYEYQLPTESGEEIWNEFTSQPSVGSYFHKNIKGKYEAIKL